jgi:hypothetical protein
MDSRRVRGNDNEIPETFEAVMETWTPEIKALYESHTQGLRNTVTATRTERDALKTQLADIARTLGSDPAKAKEQIDTLAAQLEAANRRAGFMEEAGKPEIGCSDAKLALIAALEIDAIDEKGKVDWGALRQQFPTLFRARGSASAGAGTQGAPGGRVDMNAAIRRAAGRG